MNAAISPISYYFVVLSSRRSNSAYFQTENHFDFICFQFDTEWTTSKILRWYAINASPQLTSTNEMSDEMIASTNRTQRIQWNGLIFPFHPNFKFNYNQMNDTRGTDCFGNILALVVSGASAISSPNKHSIAWATIKESMRWCSLKRNSSVHAHVHFSVEMYRTRTTLLRSKECPIDWIRQILLRKNDSTIRDSVSWRVSNDNWLLV